MSKENTPTPHNAAKYGEIAKTVIMAGDPVRVKYIAENFLENPVLYNSVRGILGYTGTYKGKKVSVQAHGMGIPSIGIYTYELFNFYDVEKIIRIGTCGSFKAEVKLGSIVIAEGAGTCVCGATKSFDGSYSSVVTDPTCPEGGHTTWTCSVCGDFYRTAETPANGHNYEGQIWQYDSAYTAGIQLPGPYSAIADFTLLRDAVAHAEKEKLDFEVGNVLTSDCFYNEGGKEPQWARLGVLAVEMEAYGLYFNAAISGKKALAILSVSDNTITHEELSAEQRALGLNNMIKMALEIA